MPLALLGLLLFALTAAQARGMIETRLAASESRDAPLAENMLLWHQAAVAWRQAHPGFSGTMPSSIPLLPPWYAALAPWHVLVSADGQVSTFASASDGIRPERLVARLSSATGNGVNAGRAANGLIQPPARAAILAKPSGIPDGAAVIVTLVNP